MSAQSVLPAWSVMTTWGCYVHAGLPTWASIFCYVCLWSPACGYAYLARLLCLPGLLCLLLSSMPTRSPAPVSTCTELICLVILPGVLPGLLPTVPSAVFMYSTYIMVSYACLVCYDYKLVMPTHVVSIACLVGYGLPCYACPVASACLVFCAYAWSAVPTSSYVPFRSPMPYLSPSI